MKTSAQGKFKMISGRLVEVVAESKDDKGTLDSREFYHQEEGWSGSSH